MYLFTIPNDLILVRYDVSVVCRVSYNFIQSKRRFPILYTIGQLTLKFSFQTVRVNAGVAMDQNK